MQQRHDALNTLHEQVNVRVSQWLVLQCGQQSHQEMAAPERCNVGQGALQLPNTLAFSLPESLWPSHAASQFNGMYGMGVITYKCILKFISREALNGQCN